MEHYILFTIFFIVYLILNAFENYAREKWRDGYNYKYWSGVWHSVQSARWVVVIVPMLFLTIGAENFILLLPASAIWKIFYDGLLNLFRGYNFWRVSEHKDLSFWERYSTPTNKLLYLILTLTICYIYYRV